MILKGAIKILSIRERRDIMWKKIICWALVVIWLVVIFKFSATDGQNSDGQSKGVLMGVLAEGTLIAQKIGMIENNLTQNQVENLMEALNKPIRKVAHATIYCVLSILLLYAFFTKEKTLLRNCIIVAMLCFLYSLTDEFHQTYIDGRTGMFTDCLIDTFGAILGCLVYQFILKLKNNKEKPQ